jgi:hypothetical protein
MGSSPFAFQLKILENVLPIMPTIEKLFYENASECPVLWTGALVSDDLPQHGW